MLVYVYYSGVEGNSFLYSKLSYLFNYEELVMSTECFTGAMTPFGGNFSIRNYAFCHGQTVSISEFQALYSLIGTYYSGDGRVTFGLPDLRGRSPVGCGRSPGFSNYIIGGLGGREVVTLSSENLPTHNHNAVFIPASSEGSLTSSLQVATNGSNTETPDSSSFLAASSTPMYYKSGSFSPSPTLTSIEGLTIDDGRDFSGTIKVENAGLGDSFGIMNPYQVINWQIMMDGVYPSRN